MTVPPPVRDLVVLLARVGIGAVFVAHGWQKLADTGIDGVAAGFEQMDVPLATASAWFAALVELIGGAALILGAATPVVGLLLVADMLGAYVFVHAGNGMFVTEGGAELVLALGAAALLTAAVGPGRYSVDHALLRSRRRPAAVHG
ncbi:DoxX family protein [Jiangella aurantiaca]|uniref:DoxX family protein n=1 Tax=Jiangella aurantiaca TaxID=2530373 RepID=A0A4V6PEF2_9ACTN|nr:DoxX family protein [Jiangella aurantiaca]TDD67207.1 DoxX family protein [Jiangella aurantiaca]